MLAANLKNLYVLAELRYNGIVTSGTNSLTSVYLKIGRVNDGFTAAHIEGTFHAEFSSILLRNFKSSFDAAAWQALNPPEFRYLGNGVDAVKQGKAGQVPSDDLHNEGFLVEYSRSTMENDLNGFAKKLFNGDPSLWATAAKYPRIKAKLDLTIAFYQKLDASFTEAFFRSLRTSAR